MTAQIGVRESEEHGVRVVSVDGELDLASAPKLCARLSCRYGGKLLVDLSDLEFCDSTGLRALLGAAREVRANGGRMALACPPESGITRLLEVVGVREHLIVRDDVAAATKALGAGPT